MNSRRTFLKAVAVAPLAIKYASLEGLFGPPKFVDMKAAQFMFEKVSRDRLSPVFWEWLKVHPFVRPSDQLLYVTHLTGKRSSDGTHFYTTLSLPAGSEPFNLALLKQRIELAVVRFEGWQECGCKVGWLCKRHGGPMLAPWQLGT